VIILDLATGEQVAAIDVPGEPHGLALSPDGKWAYVVQRRLNQLALIDTGSRQITKTEPAGKRPDMIVVSPDGKTLYVTSRDENKLLVVAATDLKVTAQVDTGDEHHGVAYRK
jgi:YVTN family beta-propeller protein